MCSGVTRCGLIECTSLRALIMSSFEMRTGLIDSAVLAAYPTSPAGTQLGLALVFVVTVFCIGTLTFLAVNRGVFFPQRDNFDRWRRLLDGL
jgi:hypothetical protein